MTLEVHFTETFQGETVILRLAEGEAVEVADLHTDPRSSLARRVTLPSPSGATTLSADLKGGLSASVRVEPMAIQFVAAELQSGTLILTPVTKVAFAAEPRGFA